MMNQLELRRTISKLRPQLGEMEQPFAETLLSSNEWTPAHERAAVALVKQHGGRLGLDTSQLVLPTVDRAIELSGRDFAIRFRYEPWLVDAMRAWPSEARPRWDPDARVWRIGTSHAEVSALQAFAEQHGFTWGQAAQALARDILARREQMQRALDESPFPIPGLVGQLDPHQYAFVRYALWRKRVLNADQMGCGKTIESLAAVQAASAFPCVIVSPAAMKLVWRDELRTWLPGRSVQVVNSDNQPARGYDFTLLNYEILDRHLQFLQGLGPRSLIIDEAHAVKEETSKRTAAVRALAKGSLLHAPPEHIFLLTGTPVLNRPMELMSPLDILGWLDHFGGSWDYRMRYCSPSRSKSGIVFQGASNLPELHEKLLETCFIRRKKADVLKHLPPKTRDVLPVRLTNPEEYARAHAGIVDWLQQEGRKTYVQGLARIEVCRQVAAKGKLAYTRGWIDDFLKTGDKLVVFAHHVAMQDALLRLFPASATMRAGQSEGERYNNIRRFQQDDTCQLMVASLGAGSVGVTLTASAHVLMTQLGWTPAIHDQAEDRCHRRGQRRPVTATYLIGEKTVEEKLWGILEKKRIIVNTIHDGEDVDEQSVVKELMDSLAAEA